MRNKFEHILLAILLGSTILLGLSFWLNTIFNFNIFCGEHWGELSRLQASHIPIATGFYISFVIAISLFMVGLYFIYRNEIRRIHLQKIQPVKPIPVQQITNQIEKVEQKEEIKPTEIKEATINFNRPPRLNLPKNMAQIAEQKNIQTPKNTPVQTPTINPYNPIISDAFSGAGYLVKPNPTISGFTPNLFAIGNNEIVWVGGVDCDMEKMLSALQKLDSVFKETLEDIEIHISGFILDTMNRYENNDSLQIFKSIDELKEFIHNNPADEISDEDQESFDSYSEYIDTIIKYIKNI